MVAVGLPHDVTQRGNNRQKVFFSDTDRRLYLAPPQTHSRRWMGWCLMPNHVHLIALPRRENSLAKALGRTHHDYVVYLNLRRRQSGHLWQNRFYSTALDRAHLHAALRYVDLNPVRARLIDDACAYQWSSAAAHVHGVDREGLLDLEWWKELCPLNDWARALKESHEVEEQDEKIR